MSKRVICYLCPDYMFMVCIACARGCAVHRDKAVDW